MDVLRQIIPKAEQLATNSLKGGKWDTDAFLVLSMIELLKPEQVASVSDLVPDSTVDEKINSIQDYFVEYMRDRTTNNLYKMLLQTEQMLSELYQSLSDQDEIVLFENFISQLQKFKQ